MENVISPQPIEGKPKFTCEDRMISWIDPFKIRVLQMVHSTNQHGGYSTMLQFSAKDLPGWVRSLFEDYWRNQMQIPSFQGQFIYDHAETLMNGKMENPDPESDADLSSTVMLYEGMIRFDYPPCTPPNTVLLSSPAWPQPKFGSPQGFDLCSQNLWMMFPIYLETNPGSIYFLRLSMHTQPPCL